MCSSRCALCREHRGTHQYDCPVAWSCTSSHGSLSAGGALPALPCASTKGLRGEKSVIRRVFVRGRADATARPESSPTGGGEKKNATRGGHTHTHRFPISQLAQYTHALTTFRLERFLVTPRAYSLVGTVSIAGTPAARRAGSPKIWRPAVSSARRMAMMFGR